MSITQNEKAGHFRALHDSPGPPNSKSMGCRLRRILAALGFQALATSSAAASAFGRRGSRTDARRGTGAPASDCGGDGFARLCRSGNGFGEAPEVVAETIRLGAEVGLVGCAIEDATATKTVPSTIFD
jgi:2-methylisocitrate lyase-like PEP mutase family enzyme